MFGDYWLVSDRLKVLFEALDASAFAFQSCDVLTSRGSAGPTYWLCDVVRVLEAFDEQTSQRLRQNRLKFPSLRTARLLYFDAVAIGKAHIFRNPYWIPDIFCDQFVKDACKRAGIKGLRFVDCTPKTARKAGQRRIRSLTVRYKCELFKGFTTPLSHSPVTYHAVDRVCR